MWKLRWWEWSVLLTHTPFACSHEKVHLLVRSDLPSMSAKLYIVREKEVEVEEWWEGKRCVCKGGGLRARCRESVVCVCRGEGQRVSLRGGSVRVSYTGEGV
jgi:hypothetical protein